MKHFLFLLLISFAQQIYSQNDRLRDSLEGILQSSPYFVTAQRRLVELDLEVNTVVSRKNAEETIHKALELLPRNMDLQVLLVHVLYERQAYLAAEDLCDKIIKSATLDIEKQTIADAHYYKGLCSEKQALKYKDMKSFVETNNFAGRGPVKLSLDNYGEESMKETAHQYEQCLELNPLHRGALLRLGLLYFEIGKYEPMVSLFQKILKTNPRDKEAHTYAALGYYQLGQQEIAQDYYGQAMNLMSNQELGEFNYLGYIVPSLEMKEYLKGASEPSKAFEYERQFWQKKDPLYLTPYNERLIEHYNRMTYADLRFGVPRLKLAGWNTEKGMIYIRYGKPQKMFKVQPYDKRLDREIQNSAKNYRTYESTRSVLGGGEWWFYPHFSFYFEDEYASGQYLLDQNSYRLAQSVYREREDHFEMPVMRQEAMTTKVYQFKNHDGTTRLQCYYALQTASTDSAQRAMAGLFFLNSSFDAVSQVHSEVDLKTVTEYEGDRYGRMELNQPPLNLKELSYSMEMLDSEKRWYAVYRGSVELHDYHSKELTVSDVIIAHYISNQKSLTIIPNFQSRTSRNKDIYLYFEVYNLSLNNDGEGQYKVETALTKQGKKGLEKYVPSLFQKLSDNKVSSTFEVVSRERDDPYFLSINLSDVPPGQYDLSLQIIDLISGEKAIRYVPLSVDP